MQDAGPAGILKYSSSSLEYFQCGDDVTAREPLAGSLVRRGLDTIGYNYNRTRFTQPILTNYCRSARH